MLSMASGSASAFSVGYVVLLSRPRIRLYVNDAHVGVIDVIRRELEHAHWAIFQPGACAVQLARGRA